MSMYSVRGLAPFCAPSVYPSFTARPSARKNCRLCANSGSQACSLSTAIQHMVLSDPWQSLRHKLSQLNPTRVCQDLTNPSVCTFFTGGSWHPQVGISSAGSSAGPSAALAAAKVAESADHPSHLSSRQARPQHAQVPQEATSVEAAAAGSGYDDDILYLTSTAVSCGCQAAAI